MDKNNSLQERVRALMPRVERRREIFASALRGFTFAARQNADFNEWYLRHEAEQAQRNVSELAVKATQQPAPEDLQVRQAVSELQNKREEVIMERDQDIRVTEARRNLEQVWNPSTIQGDYHDLAA